jgi:hypothetical protein
MEDYLKQLKPKDGVYTLPVDKFNMLLERYSDMKKRLGECASMKIEYDRMKKDYAEFERQIFIIIGLEQELTKVKQENVRILHKAQETLDIGKKARQERDEAIRERDEARRERDEARIGKR